MEKISCSCTWGDGNLNHNFNEYSRSRQEHIDNTKIKDNIILKEISNKTIEKEFNKIFENDIKEYNEKQTRNDRKIQSYYQKVLNDKKIRAPFREVIYQVGNKDNSKDPIVREKMIKTLKNFYEEFEKNYPKLKIIGAVIHLDESTPHLHIDVVPYADGSKKGLKHKVSFEKAIEQMGFVPEQSEVNKSDKDPLIFNGFRNHSMRLLEDLMNNESLQRDIKFNTEKHLSVKAFKEKKAIEELKKLPEIQEKAKNEILNKMEIKENLEQEIQFLQNKKEKKEEEIEELEIKHKKEKQRLAKEYEKQKQLYNSRIFEMQNSTIEQEQRKPSFWNKIEDMVSKSKFFATVACAITLYNIGLNGNDIIREIKKFRKNFDLYRESPEILKSDIDLLKNDSYTSIDIKEIENMELEEMKMHQEKEEDYEMGDW